MNNFWISYFVLSSHYIEKKKTFLLYRLFVPNFTIDEYLLSLFVQIRLQQTDASTGWFAILYGRTCSNVLEVIHSSKFTVVHIAHKLVDKSHCQACFLRQTRFLRRPFSFVYISGHISDQKLFGFQNKQLYAVSILFFGYIWDIG